MSTLHPVHGGVQGYHVVAWDVLYMQNTYTTIPASQQKRGDPELPFMGPHFTEGKHNSIPPIPCYCTPAEGLQRAHVGMHSVQVVHPSRLL